MCQQNTYKEKKHYLSVFFNNWWDTYTKSPSKFITKEQYKAVAAIRVCRTEALGVDHYVCEECGEITQIYHSCKNRFCPTCSWKDTLKWADKMKSQLLDIPHRHVVFTLPHKLNPLINDNKVDLLSTLFQTAAESIKDWIHHKYKLTPGIINVLHTFGEKKDLHPHIHMILSWGGINSNYGVEPIKGEYINYEFIQTKFRCKFEDKLIELFDNKALQHDFNSRIDFMRYIKQINDKHWRIHFEPAMAIPTQVIRYIGRYSKRACLSEYKITNIEGEYISFSYKDYKKLDFNGKAMLQVLRLHYRDFFPRLLQHVPLPYFRLVRYYGAYAARTKAILNKKLIDIKVIPEPARATDEANAKGENPKICKHCKTEKAYLYTTISNKKGERFFMTRFNPKKKHNKPNIAAA